MPQTAAQAPSSVDAILDRMDHQREAVFAELATLPEERLWRRPGPKDWSIGENLDHMGRVYASFLPFFRLSWALLLPLAKLRRKRPYRVEIDNVYHRPAFPQNVGALWPSRYNAARPAALEMLRAGVEQIHRQTRAFYAGKDPDLLGHVALWDPAIGTVNLIQALRVGVYHDEVHIDSIREMLRAG